MTLRKTRRSSNGRETARPASAGDKRSAAQGDLFEPHMAKRYSAKATGIRAHDWANAANAEFAKTGDRVAAIRAGCRAARDSKA